jgi:O-antigen/teichoic acid export membrane protein
MTPRGVRRAVLPLLLGSLCAQLLLNGPPILVPLLARNLEQADLAGRFVAGYTLARIPLFLMVPLQTALLPLLTRLLHGGDRAVLRKVTLRLSLGLLALAVAAFGLGYGIGPWLVGLVFGQGYRLGAFDMALLSVGVAAYLGMVLVTQVLVASVRHSHVAWAWLSGVVVAVVTVLVVPDLLLSAELAFVLGSTVGWAVGTVLMLSRTRNRELTRV